MRDRVGRRRFAWQNQCSLPQILGEVRSWVSGSGCGMRSMTGITAGREQREVLASVIIVSWNTRNLTLACLESFYRTTERKDIEVIVVDNASVDGTPEAVKAQVPHARVLVNAANLGFGRAVNLASSGATGRYLLLLNPDTIVLDGAIDRLLHFAELNPAAGIWGGGTLFEDGTTNPSSCWDLPTIWSVFCNALAVCHLFRGSTFFNRESFGGWARDTVREVGMISGCFLLIERTLFLKLGGFDPVFFMYGEDADLCARARKLGARPLFTPDATIVHLGRQSDTAGNISSYLMGARIELTRRLLPPNQAWLAERLVVAGVALRRLVYGALSILVRDRMLVEKACAWRFTWSCRHLWRQGPIAGPLTSRERTCPRSARA